MPATAQFWLAGTVAGPTGAWVFRAGTPQTWKFTLATMARNEIENRLVRSAARRARAGNPAARFARVDRGCGRPQVGPTSHANGNATSLPSSATGRRCGRSAEPPRPRHLAQLRERLRLLVALRQRDIVEQRHRLGHV